MLTVSPKARRIGVIVIRVVAVLAIMVAAFGLALVLYSHHQNKTIIVTEYTVSHEQIPDAFDGKRIVQLTDLHNADFGDKLTALVVAQRPDIIVITGDWIGYNDTDITVAKRQAAALTGIAPIYYTAGNHEVRSPLCDELLAYFDSLGFYMLHNRAVEWMVDGECVEISGKYDPEFCFDLSYYDNPITNQGRYNILLFHRPESFEETVSWGADLVLAGHTHGGQIRLPLIGAVYAPNQGRFPTYDVGRFEYDDATMIISQGLGQSVASRILTPPEIVVVTLDADEK